MFCTCSGKSQSLVMVNSSMVWHVQLRNEFMSPTIVVVVMVVVKVVANILQKMVSMKSRFFPHVLKNIVTKIIPFTWVYSARVCLCVCVFTSTFCNGSSIDVTYLSWVLNCSSLILPFPPVFLPSFFLPLTSMMHPHSSNFTSPHLFSSLGCVHQFIRTIPVSTRIRGGSQ